MFLTKGEVDLAPDFLQWPADSIAQALNILHRLVFSFQSRIREGENMLVLSRKIEQSIQIGNDVWITILNIDRNDVSIGITAPKDVRVMRTEVLQRDQRREQHTKWTDENQ